MRSPLSTLALLILAVPLALAQQAPAHPRDAAIHDPDTLAWWHTTEALSGDSMEGRDTGSAAYQRAADLVARRFREAGLKPQGDHGSFFQTVPMHQVDIQSIGTSFTLLRPNTAPVPLPFLEQITLAANAALPPDSEAPLTFRGYCGKEAMGEIAGKIVLCFGTQQRGLPSAGERTANARAGHAAGIVTIDNPFFTVEPPRWPYAYARTVTLRTGKPPRTATGPPMLALRVGQPAYSMMLAGSGQDAVGILRDGGAGKPLPSFELPSRLHVTLNITQKDISSPNVLAVLPGTDPTLREEYVVIAAHLDGYGYGTSVGADNLYNGALDDAAYVALLLQFAVDIHEHRQPAPKRSVLFCAFTGEEKGLLGSNWYVQHPTIPLANTVADINLDQLRPLFPLKILTALAIDDTTLGATAKQVGAPMGIEIRPDREPERGLLRRADHWPFLQAGVPAIGFIFGYDPGTDAERRYREWYNVRYHRPQDDTTQPIDFDAAAKFDTFFYNLVEAIANAPEKPAFTAQAPYGRNRQ